MIEKRKAFNFEIKKDTVIALITAVVMLPVYYVNTHFGRDNVFVFILIFLVLGHLILNTLIPAWVVLKLNNEGLNGLGITKSKLLLSIIISIVIAVLSYYQLMVLVEKQPGIDLVPHLIFNSLLLWEVLFIFGWLQLRLEKAFGYIFAPVLSAIFFCFYHLGSMSLEDLSGLFIAGLIFSILFGLTRNIFTLIPIAWSVSSGIGTIMGGFVGVWSDVAIYSVVLLFQIIIIYVMNKNSTQNCKKILIKG